MEDYKANSHKSKEEPVVEKRVETVISGAARSKKKGGMQKFADVFISDDVQNVKSYIFMDVIIPTAKKAISDIVTIGIDMILYGESNKTRSGSSGTKVSYRNYYDNDRERKRGYSSSQSRNGFDYDDIVFDMRGDAESVLDAMTDIISQYGVVSVADLYDLANVSTSNYACNKYGWTDIRGGKPIRVRDGYVLKLPKALPLN